MIIELMIQHYLTSPNIKNIIKSRKIAYLGAKFFLAPCFFMLVCAFSWEQRKLGDMCDEFQSGKSIKASDITDSGEYAVYGGNGFRGYTDTYNHDGDYALIGRQGALCGNMNFSSFPAENKIGGSGQFIGMKKNFTAQRFCSAFHLGIVNNGFKICSQSDRFQ